MLEQFVLHNAYFLLIPLAILEGPFLAIACGVGAGLGVLSLPVAYGILIAGDLLPDLMYYFIGRYGATLSWVRRAATRIKLLREHLPALEHLWRTQLLSTLTSAKLAYGVSAPLIVSAGMTGVPLRRFVAASLMVGGVYLGGLMLLGYALSSGFSLIALTVGNAELIVSLAGAFFFCVLIFAIWWARRQLSPRGMQRLREKSNIILPEER